MVVFGVLAIWAVLFIFAALALSKSAGNVHGTLDKFMADAKATNDIVKLCELNKQLIAYAEKKCWHRHFGTHAKEINVYICAKLEGIAVREDLRKS